MILFPMPSGILCLSNTKSGIPTQKGQNTEITFVVISRMQHYMKYDMPPAATARLEVFSFLFRDFLEIYLLQ